MKRELQCRSPKKVGFEVEYVQVDIHLIKKRIARPLGHRLRERYQNFENEGFSKFSIFPSPEEREYRERWSPSWLRGDGENRKSYIPLLEIALKSSLLSDSQESF